MKTLLLIFRLGLYISIGLSKPYSDCPQSEVDKLEYNSSFSKALSFKVDCEPPDVEKICKTAEDKCVETTGNSQCFWGLPGPPRCPNPQDATEDEILRKKAENFSYTIRKFYQITADPTLQTHCCGSDQVCKEGWSKTKLIILRGLQQDNLVGHNVNDQPPRVELSVSIVAQCRNTDCLDHLLYHELGHSCHTWHYRKNDNKTVRYGYPSESEMGADLSAYLGPRGGSCVLKDLKAYYENLPGWFNLFKIDRSSWQEEAFADAAFIENWGPAALSWDCLGVQDNLHAQPKAFLRCFLDQPQFKAKFCGSLPTQAPSPSNHSSVR